MASNIQTLPQEVVHLIAAGEVIDSAAAAVRELVENALDAGATRITITLSLEQWQVRVTDNGRGMDLHDLQQAAMPHSTSKIRDGADLWCINSLGFRGEALHSLAQLSQLEICSRPAGGEAGWRVSYTAQGEPDITETVAIAPGTVVTISNLFGVLPTRRQGLPSLAQQLRSIQTVIQQIALCHPHITWQVEQNDRPWFAIWPGKTAQQILPQLLRDIHPGDLQELTLSPGSPTPLYLLLGLPDRCHRYRPDWIKIAVNGRVVKVPELEQAIFAALRRTLPRDRHPVCFLHLQVPPNQIDWNRHPAKTEIYLHNMSIWQDQVMQAIDQALSLSRSGLQDSAAVSRIGQLLKASEVAGEYGKSRTIQPDSATSNLEAAEADSGTDEQPSSLASPLRAIAQVHNMYILAEHPTGVWLVEQHIAHERVLYEQLRDRWQIVPLDPPVILGQLLPHQLEQLQRIGLEVEVFGEQLWAVRNAPEPLARRDDCADALLELSLGGDLESALVATACRTAIRNGTALSLHDMQTLLNQWQQTHNPRTCPHGRPIYLPLEESSLSRFFRRHWVIGKSHGI